MIKSNSQDFLNTLAAVEIKPVTFNHLFVRAFLLHQITVVIWGIFFSMLKYQWNSA